jgi:hypothetical protein
VGILATNEPGILLTGVFDKKSPTAKKEVAAFEAKLSELQKKLGLSGFVTAIKKAGDKVTVKVLAAASNAPAAAAVKPAARPASGGGWTPKGQSAREVGQELKSSLGWGKK